jgi:hypothetical protein
VYTFIDRSPPIKNVCKTFQITISKNSNSIPKKFKLAHLKITHYSHLFNKRGGWNKRVGGAKVAKSLNVEAEINVEGGIFWKKLVHKSNKRGLEGGKI